MAAEAGPLGAGPLGAGPPPAAAPRSSGRGRLAAVVVAAAVVAARWAFLRSENQRLAESQPAQRRSTPLDAIPRDAMLLVTADLGALRRAGVAADLLAAGREVPGLGDVRAACGFDPVEAFDEIALAIPESGAEGEFGVVAAGGVKAEQILACSAKVIEVRGGKPAVSQVGGFATVRDVSLPTAGGEIAARPGDRLVLLGSGAYLRAMVDAADGVVPGARGHESHHRLRASLGEGLAARASVVLGRKQRAAIADEVERSGASGAPPFIARVTSAALGVAFDGEVAAVHVILGCDDARGALEVAAAVEKLRGEQAASPMLRLAGFGDVIDGLALEVERDLVHVRLRVSRRDAEKLAAIVLGARPGGDGPGAAPPPGVSATAALPEVTAAPSASAAPPDAPAEPPPRAPDDPLNQRL